MIATDNEYKVYDDKYEYPRIELKDKEAKYIRIPWSIITNTELDAKRVGIFTYLRIRYGYDNIIGFTIPSIVEWCGLKPNKRADKSNSKFLDVIDALSDMGYLTYLTECSKSSYMECEFNLDYYYKECSNKYSVVYLDEVEKILKYKKNNANDNTLTNTTILLVFAYLRHKIIRRPNELQPEECYPEKIKSRQERCPEAYDDNINDMATEIGISSKTFLKIIDILECDLKLIVTDRAYRVKNDEGEFRTPPTIFANAYKREDKYLLVTGSKYSRTEINLKAEKIKKYFKGYKINEDKRK